MLASKLPVGLRLVRLSHRSISSFPTRISSSQAPPATACASCPHSGTSFRHAHSLAGWGAVPVCPTPTHDIPSRRCHSQSAEKIVKSDHWVPEPPISDVVTTMFNRFDQFSHHTAVLCELLERSYTYGEIQDCSMRIAAAIQSQLGGQRPKCVAVLSPNVPEYPMVVLGSLAVGSTVTTVASLMTAAEIANQLSDSGSDVVVVDPMLEDNLLEALELLGDLPRPVVLVNGPSSSGAFNLQEIVKDQSYPKAERAEIPPDATSLILYSSGTTGKPKGVCQSHKSLSLYLPCYVHPEFISLKESLAFEQDACIGLIPFYHTFGLFAILFASLYRGSKLVCMPMFDPTQFVSIIHNYKVEMLHLVPPLLNFLAHTPSVTPKQLASVRHVLIASAPVHPAVAKAFKTKTHHTLHFQEALGLTETMAIMLTPMSEERIGYCGKLLPNHEARVVDIVSGKDLGPEESGELWIRGPGMMSHYHNNPEATKASITSDGWFKTGDLVTYTPDGFFKVVDRIKELIKVKAHQVAPTELEDLVLQVEGVGEAGVVGVEDERSGELPRAYVVLKDPSMSSEEQEAVRTAIKKRMSDKAASYKQLDGGIIFVEDLPKNPTGKLLRRQLKEMAHSDRK